MKNIFLTTALTAILATFLASCTQETSQISANSASPKNAAKYQKALDAFNDICLQTAPSFAKAEANAKTYGIVDKMPLGAGVIISSKDAVMNAQIKPSVECAVGNDTVGGSEVVTVFIKMIANKTGAHVNSLPTKTPFMASLNGQTYIFHLDRQGGDTFVMLKPSK